jgi:hypothetical protein
MKQKPVAEPVFFGATQAGFEAASELLHEDHQLT